MAEDCNQEIRERAYRIWQDEGEPAGRDQEHWSRAQAELGNAGSDGDDQSAPASAEDLPSGEPEDTGAADASLGEEGGFRSTETPQTSGIAAAAGTPVAPAPASKGRGRKGKGVTKVSN